MISYVSVYDGSLRSVGSKSISVVTAVYFPFSYDQVPDSICSDAVASGANDVKKIVNVPSARLFIFHFWLSPETG